METKRDASSVRYSSSSIDMEKRVYDRAKKRIIHRVELPNSEFEALRLQLSRMQARGISHLILRCVRFVTQLEPCGTAGFPRVENFGPCSRVAEGSDIPPRMKINLISFGITLPCCPAPSDPGHQWTRDDRSSFITIG
jgi:hypothetical protein